MCIIILYIKIVFKPLNIYNINNHLFRLFYKSTSNNYLTNKK